MISGAILWFLALRTHQAILYKTALGWIAVSAAITFPVFFTGQNSHELLHGLPGLSHNIIDTHEQWGTYTLAVSIVTGILALSGLFQLKKSDKLSPFLKGLITLFVVVISGIAGYTGHLGGQIRHTEIRPGFIPVQEQTENSEHHHHHHDEKEQGGKQ